MVILFSFIIVFTVLLAFMIYTSEAHWTFKALALATFLSFDILAYEHYVDNLGAPIPYRPAVEFQYVWHTVAPTQPPQILLWAVTPEHGNRLYQFDYVRKEAEELEKQRQGVMDGQPGQWLHYGDEGTNGDSMTIMTIPNQNLIKP